MLSGLENGTVGAFGQCTDCTRTPLRSRTKKRLLLGDGGLGKIGGATTLSSTLLGEERPGAATLRSEPCGNEREKDGGSYVMLGPILMHNDSNPQYKKHLK